MDIRDRVALVTGGSSGIGRATAELLAQRGAAVVVNYSRSVDAADATVAAISAAGGQACAVQGDVSRSEDCGNLVAAACERFGALHILINNAGVTEYSIPWDDLDQITDAMYDRVFDVNVRGTFCCTRAAAPAIRTAGGGAIVNVSSILAFTHGGFAPYAAAKAAVISLTKSTARLLAPEIRVNCVAPGTIDTRMTREGFGERWPQLRSRVEERTPLRRLATPEQCAQAIGALVENDAITGESLLVDGGGALMH